MNFFNFKILKSKKFKLLKFIFLIISIFTIFNILKPIYAQDWYNTSWAYRLPITIHENSGSNLTNFQVHIIVNTQALISAGKMNPDCSDIRFTYYNSTSNTETEIPYWIESGCNTTNTSIWVKVPYIPANSNVTIYMYYGNPNVTFDSLSNNGSAVFIQFLNLSQNSIPPGWTWTVINTPSGSVSGNVSISNGTLYISNTNGNGVWDENYQATLFYYNATVSGNFVAVAKVTSLTNTNPWAMAGIIVQNSINATTNNGEADIVATPGNGIAFQWVSSSSDIAPDNNSNGGKYSFPVYLKLVKVGSYISGYYSGDGVNWTQQGTAVSPIGISNNQYIALFVTPHASATATATFTLFYVRQYVSVSPSVYISQEQSYVYVNVYVETPNITNVSVVYNVSSSIDTLISNAPVSNYLMIIESPSDNLTANVLNYTSGYNCTVTPSLVSVSPLNTYNFTVSCSLIFTFILNPSYITVNLGASNVSTINFITAISSNVTFNCSTPNTNIECNVSPNVLNTNNTAVVSVYAYNVSGGLYNVTITATDGQTVVSQNLSVDVIVGYYSVVSLSYPSVVPVSNFYINSTIMCTYADCNPGTAVLIYPGGCTVGNTYYNIPPLNAGDTYNLSFEVSCIYLPIYNFSIIYTTENYTNSSNITLFPFFYNVYHTISNNTLYLHIEPVGQGANVTYYISYLVKDAIYNTSISNGTVLYTAVSDTDNVVFSYNLTPGLNFTFIISIAYPYNWSNYPVSIYNVSYIPYTQPSINSVAVQYAYQLYGGLVCYNVSDELAVTNVSLFIDLNAQWVMFGSKSYLNRSVSDCMNFSTDNLQVGSTYLAYIAATSYTGNVTESPVIPFTVSPAPEYIINVSYPSATQEPSAIINLTVTHPLESIINCSIQYSNELSSITVYNNTPYLFTVPLSYGINNIYITCGDKVYTTKAIQIVMENTPPYIESVNIVNNTLLINAADSVGLSEAIVNLTINNITQIYVYNLSGTSSTIPISLQPGYMYIDAIIYNLAGLSTSFVAKFNIPQSSTTSSTGVSSSTTSTLYTIILPLFANISANLTNNGISVIIDTESSNYPVFCTVFPFNETVEIYSSNPVISVFTPKSAGLYSIYAVCVDRAGDEFTTNTVLLNVPEDFIRQITAAALARETTPAGLIALGTIVLVLGILFASRWLALVGLIILGSSVPVYTLLTTGSPILTALSSAIVVVVSAIIYKVLIERLP